MKFRFVVSAVLSLFAIQSFAAKGTMVGDGSAEKPFLIEDYEDLKAIGTGAYLYSSDYALAKDIDASASAHEMCDGGSCNGFITIGKNKDASGSTYFKGNIDGRNHTISDLNIWLPCEDDIGFISVLDGKIANLKFERLNVTGRVSQSRYVGGVVALLHGSIENVHVTNGFVQGQLNVGGIAGRIYGSSVLKNASFQGEVVGDKHVGGLVGQSNGNILSVSASVNIKATGYDIGGIVGYIENSSFVRSAFSRGTIVGEAASVGGIVGSSDRGYVLECVSMMDLMHSHLGKLESDIGGIVGENSGKIEQSYFIGNVEGFWNVGGVAGSNDDTLRNVYAIGNVKGDSAVGGLVGENSEYIENSYTASIVHGGITVGGLVGNNYGETEYSYWDTEISGLDTSAGGIGLTTSQMMTFSSFSGWDTLGYKEYEYIQKDPCDGIVLDSGWCYRATDGLVHYWSIDEGKSFPYLTVTPHVTKALVPIATPTAVAKWQESPKVASLLEVNGKLVGEWLDWIKTNDSKDSLYYGYRIGMMNGSDTIWGTSSYVAVPNKIEISTLDELKKIGYDPAYPLAGNYELTADINGLGSDFKPIGDSVHVFSGSFDGKNHTIKNMQIGSTYRDFSGLFGYAEKAVIKNLKLLNMKIVGDWYVGALAGAVNYSLVENVVSLDGDIQGSMNVGGLIGKAGGSEINIVGTTGKVKGEEEVGGLIGSTGSMITNAFSVNVVKGFEDVGGAVGYYTGSLSFIKNVYSASLLKGRNDVKGLVGYPHLNTLTNCYFDSTITGHSSEEGRTTAEMLMKNTYEGFDFESVWNIQEGVSYPYFKGMDPILPGTLIDDGSVNVLAGAGTEMRPYKISSYHDLKYIGKYEYTTDLYYMLTSNIDASDSRRESCNGDGTICKGFEPIQNFKGVFIGNKKKISYLWISRESEDNVGLFGSLASTAKVSGLVVESVNIRGKDHVGVIAGEDAGATLDSIYVAGNIAANDYVGSIVGSKTSGSIAHSASKGSVAGNEFVGGIAGSINKATVSDCYSMDTVSGKSDVGGLFGLAKSAAVSNSYAAGDIKATSKLGGLAGEASASTFTSVYYDSLFWGVNVTAAGNLRTTQQMVNPENYKNWDFKNTWQIAADTSYPYLKWIGVKTTPDLYRDSSMLRMAGSGTESDPFLIKTYGDLKSIGFGKYKLSAVYRLKNDIDASVSKNEVLRYGKGYGFKPICKVWSVPSNIVTDGRFEMDDSGVFTGKIHGGGHSIKGLRIDYNANYTALVDSLGESAVIDSLTLTDFTGSSKHLASIAIGSLGLVRNVSVKGSLKAEGSAVGLVYNNYGKIENSSFEGSVLGLESSYKGENAGLVFLNKGSIKNARVDVEVTSLQGGAGAVIQNNEGAVIENVLVNAKMTIGGKYSGGVVSKNYGELAACSASVNIVSKGSYVGGLIGYNAMTDLKNLGVSGRVEGDQYVGGLLGYNYSGNLSNLHASVDVTGRQFVGGLIGYGRDHLGDTISYSYATGNVTGTEFDSNKVGLNFSDENSVGGFIGGTSYVRIHDCHATGNVKNGSGFVGSTTAVIWDCYAEGDVTNGAGFVGYLSTNGIRNCHASGTVHNGSGFILDMWGSSEIDMCYATGDVYIDAEESVFRGAGFGEFNYGTITRSFATGNVYVTGEKFRDQMTTQAGFIAENYGDINRCFALGNIEGGDSAGAFVGGNYNLVRNSYALGKVKRVFSNDTTPIEGLLVGWNEADVLVSYAVGSAMNNAGDKKELSDAEMRKRESFDGFNFNTIWYIKEGESYPMLREMPNVPYVGKVSLNYGKGGITAKHVVGELLKGAIVADTSYALVIEVDSASKALLDSLEKLGKNAGGEYVVDFRVGVAIVGDTLWSRTASVELTIEKTTGARVRNVVVMHSLGAAFRDAHVAVHFGIPDAGAVKFLLMDMQGRIVKAFDLGRRAAGEYFETVAAEGVVRGRYIGVLQVNGRVTDKVMLLKR